jgi:hypothetical protein
MAPRPKLSRSTALACPLKRIISSANQDTLFYLKGPSCILGVLLPLVCLKRKKEHDIYTSRDKRASYKN